jgi:hypothetical protein
LPSREEDLGAPAVKPGGSTRQEDDSRFSNAFSRFQFVPCKKNITGTKNVLKCLIYRLYRDIKHKERN